MYNQPYNGYYGQPMPQGQYPQQPPMPQQMPAQPYQAAGPGNYYPGPSNPDVSYNYQWYDPNTQNQFYSNYPPQNVNPAQQLSPAPAAVYTPPAQYAPLPQLTGKKKAVLIGINYTGTKSELKGCVNDAKNVQQILLKSGFAPDAVHILTDDSPEPFWQPTRANIIRELDWLMYLAQSGDSLFFLFSGHGSQQEDQNGDEEDGMDETILPVDWRKAGQIVDDELHDRLVKKVPIGAKLTALMDCCHSGTGMDLPFVHTISAKEGRVISSDDSTRRRGKKSKLNEQQIQHSNMSWGDVTLFSGCRDDQCSSDARSLGTMAQGAMCYSFLKTLNAAKAVLSYYQVLSSMRDILKREGFDQIPQLSTGRPIDLNSPFLF